MKERPILFSSDMVKAILDGRKTQTRRAIKPQPPDIWDSVHPVKNAAGQILCWTFHNGADPDFHGYKDCPYGVPGDRLWVRETFFQVDEKNQSSVIYRADNHPDNALIRTWSPSIFMPRWASRIMLGITGIRVERVQDIGETDAMAEGVLIEPDPCAKHESYKLAFHCLWDSINAKRGYSRESNPWVWVIEFKRLGGKA